MNNILEVDSFESLTDFIKSVERSNSEKISEMVRNDVEMFWDIDKTISNLKISDLEIDEVMLLVKSLHIKLLSLEKQIIQHQVLINELFDDSKLIYHVIKENKGVLNESI